MTDKLKGAKDWAWCMVRKYSKGIAAAAAYGATAAARHLGWDLPAPELIAAVVVTGIVVAAPRNLECPKS